MSGSSVKSIRIRGLLSFGPEAEALDLDALNVIIGPNGSGKSNTLEALSLLQASPGDIGRPIREGGGIGDWLWRGSPTLERQAEIEVVVRDHLVSEFFQNEAALRHRFVLREAGHRLEVADERIEDEQPEPGHHKPYFYFGFEKGRPMVNVRDSKGTRGIHRELRRETVDPHQSILSQRKDPDQYPEISLLADLYGRIAIYRDWAFGRYTPPRLPQKADLPNDHLSPDASNLGLVLNRFRRDPGLKKALLAEMRVMYDGIEDFDVIVEGGTVQLFLTEGHVAIPATRLSDGTLRYLCLLAILCDPNPPPLVCIEEPELGLHPDLLPPLASLLRRAAERTQVVVTTHSDTLVSAFTETPDAVVICEKESGQTRLRRVRSEELAPWLESYRLGQLWMRGDLGGTRW